MSFQCHLCHNIFTASQILLQQVLEQGKNAFKATGFRCLTLQSLQKWQKIGKLEKLEKVGIRGKKSDKVGKSWGK